MKRSMARSAAVIGTIMQHAACSIHAACVSVSSAGIPSCTANPLHGRPLRQCRHPLMRILQCRHLLMHILQCSHPLMHILRRPCRFAELEGGSDGGLREAAVSKG